MSKYNQKSIRLIKSIALPLLVLGLSVFIINQKSFDVRGRASSDASRYPQATSCSSVSVVGAISQGEVGGKTVYYVKSGAKVVLTANTIPANGFVRWKIASFSSALSRGGSFSPSAGPKVTYKAPINKSGSDQGVEIRGDISEYPNEWLYCPPITLAIHSR
jgi:hypothetical protein